MENSNQKKDTKIETNLGMEDIEIKYIRKFLIRNLKLILTIVSSSFLLSIIYSYQQKEIWGGEFQIVIDEKNNSSSSMPNLGVDEFPQVYSDLEMFHQNYQQK